MSSNAFRPVLWYNNVKVIKVYISIEIERFGINAGTFEDFLSYIMYDEWMLHKAVIKKTYAIRIRLFKETM